MPPLLTTIFVISMCITVVCFRRKTIRLFDIECKGSVVHILFVLDVVLFSLLLRDKGIYLIALIAFIGMIFFAPFARKTISALSNLWCFACAMLVIFCAVLHLRVSFQSDKDRSFLYVPSKERVIADFIVDDINNRLDAANVLLILPNIDLPSANVIFDTLKKGIEQRDRFRNIKKVFAGYRFASSSTSQAPIEVSVKNYFPDGRQYPPDVRPPENQSIGMTMDISLHEVMTLIDKYPAANVVIVWPSLLETFKSQHYRFLVRKRSTQFYFVEPRDATTVKQWVSDGIATGVVLKTVKKEDPTNPGNAKYNEMRHGYHLFKAR